jgi:CO/xanthine dehydrogenase Mo-binding subunit
MSCEKEKNGMIGQRIPIHDAALKVTGQMKYVADMELPQMLYAKLLFSSVAHAKIKSIDTTEAEALPGVKAVVCYKNAPQAYFNSCGEVIDQYQMERIFDDTVRYVGDKVAAVAAVDEATAEKAVRLIKVEYDDLPANFDPEAGMQEEAYILHQTPDLARGNVIEEVVQNAGDVDLAMKEAYRVYEDEYSYPAIHHGAIETHTCIAEYDAQKKLTVHTSSQDSFAVRINLAKIFDMPMNKIRVTVPAIGGAFGGKIDMVLEHVVALLAIQTGRPVKLVFNRREDIASTRTRHGMKIRMKTGVKEDGTIIAQDYKVYCNAGAYACGSSNIVWAMCGKIFKNMKNPNIRFIGYPVLTNVPIGGPMRGFGSPQAFFAQQRQMNRISKDLGIDMADMERINLCGPDGMDMRFMTPHGNPRPLDCLEKAINLIGYDEAVKEQQENAGGRYRIGVGIGAGAHGNGMFGVKTDVTAMMLKMNDDGSAVLYSGSNDMGNASISLQMQMVSEVTGISMDRIACIQADTESTGYHLGDYSSRGTYVSAHAAVKVAEKMRDELLKEAAQLMGVPEQEVTLSTNTAIGPDGRTASIEDLVMHSRHQNQRELVTEATYGAEAAVTSYGVHIAKVRVDIQEGQVEILDYVAVHDVGRALNPLSVEGQIEGAVQMGVGYALSEEIELDEKGKVKNTTLRKYHLIQANEMPKRLQVGFIEEIEESGPYGAKSIGECSVVPVIAAIGNAISNAIGREMNVVPIKPERIQEAMNVEGNMNGS